MLFFLPLGILRLKLFGTQALHLPGDDDDGTMFEIRNAATDKILYSYAGKDHQAGKYVFSLDEKRIIGIASPEKVS